jgi:hypothetical protein
MQYVDAVKNRRVQVQKMAALAPDFRRSSDRTWRLLARAPGASAERDPPGIRPRSRLGQRRLDGDDLLIGSPVEINSFCPREIQRGRLDLGIFRWRLDARGDGGDLGFSWGLGALFYSWIAGRNPFSALLSRELRELYGEDNV